MNTNTAKKIDLPMVTLACIGSDHIEEAKRAVEISCRNINFGEVLHFTDVIDNNNNPHIMYNDFVVNKLPEIVKTSHCLIIQWDGFVLNHNSWFSGYLEYDFVGAINKDLGDDRCEMNGGFSLRSKKLMDLMASLKIPAEECNPEDVLINRKHRLFLEDNGCRFATKYVAKLFSVETNAYDPSIKWDGHFGFHNIYTAGVQDELRKIN